MKFEPGEKVTANVRLLRRLREGGMGAVWVAEHRTLGTEVAVKFLSDEATLDGAARARFASEATAASQVKSAHAVRIYDHGVTDTQVPFIVMELLHGEDLAQRIEREGALAPAVVATIVAQLCKALQAAHDAGVVHRDVKPGNVFLTNEDGDIFVKLLDFGVAKSDRAHPAALGKSTMAGAMLGTPYYMSPEQFRSSKNIDYRTDLWSVGVVAYEALTGSVPFVAENLPALAVVVDRALARPLTELVPRLPPELDAWFAKACAREPNARFQSARELSDALRVAASAPAPLTRSPTPIPPQGTRGLSAAMTRAQTVAENAALSRTPTVTMPPKRGRALPVVLGAGVVAVLMVGLVVLQASRKRSNDAATVASRDVPTAPAVTMTTAPAPTMPALAAPVGPDAALASASLAASESIAAPRVAVSSRRTNFKKPPVSSPAPVNSINAVPGPATPRGSATAPTNEQIW